MYTHIFSQENNKQIPFIKKSHKDLKKSFTYVNVPLKKSPSPSFLLSGSGFALQSVFIYHGIMGFQSLSHKNQKGGITYFYNFNLSC